MMLYNICYWWFFLSQGNQLTKYLAHPKIWRPKPCLLMFVSLVTLDGFHLLLSAQLTANLTPEWSSGSKFHQLSHIYAKTSFCCIEIVANNALNPLCIVDFDRLWAKHQPFWTQLSHWQMFMQNGEYTAFWYLQLLYYLMLLQFTISQNRFVEFLEFSKTTAKFGWPEHLASFVSVWLHLKSATTPEPLLPMEQNPNKTYQVIALLEHYFFPSKSKALSTHEIQILSFFFENLQH